MAYEISRRGDAAQRPFTLVMNDAASRAAPWSAAQDAILNDAAFEAAQAAIGSWPGYDAAPLLASPGLAREAGVASIGYKDESELGARTRAGLAHRGFRRRRRHRPRTLRETGRRRRRNHSEPRRMSAPVFNGERLLARIHRLGEVGALPGGGVCRLALTDADRDGRDLLVGWMRELGLEVFVDVIGNIWGVRPGAEDGPPVMIGYDTPLHYPPAPE